MAERIPSGQGGPLVVLNVLNFGHFNSYAETFARWGLEAGCEVLLLAHGQGAATPLAGRKGFAMAEISRVCRESCPEVDWDDPEQAKFALGKHCRSIVRDVAREYAPFAVLLVNADEVFFNCPEAEEPDFAFDVPVYGVVTFGRREAHLGLEDAYTRRLKAMLARRGGFAGLCSIDELHVRDNDPDEVFLHYLPDPYKEFHPLAQAVAPAQEKTAAALRLFLDAAPGPVIPILGKFDRRKGNLWILRAALASPQVRVVVLGLRVPDPEQDAEIDACLARLAQQGRAFVRFEHLPQALFDLTLGSGKVPFLPLPYRNHTGSSGLQLMAHGHGAPVLAPDFGLMAERIAAHGLGEVFPLGDEARFRARFAELLERGSGPYRADVLRFMEQFGHGPSGQGLARMFFGPQAGSSRLDLILAQRRDLPPARQYVDQARRALSARDLPGAAAFLARALEADPDNPGLDFGRSMVHWRLGRLEEAAGGFRRAEGAGLDEELRFGAQLAAQRVYEAFERESPDRQGSLAKAMYELRQWAPAEPAEQGVAIRPGTVPPDFWQQLGGRLARNGEPLKGAECFRKAIALDPTHREYRLNLSDALRYAGRFQEALEPLDELERLDPGAFGLAHKRGQVLFEQGRLPEAQAQFLREPGGSPYAAAAQEYLGRIAAQQE